MGESTIATATDWQPTACILCSINCGIEVRVEDRRIARVRGDKAHPARTGYTCEKALRLDHYQNGRDRLTSAAAPAAPTAPSRRSTGTPRSARSPRASARVRDEHGGASIFYYGGGGQGNHLGGALRRARRARALGVGLHRRTRSRRRRPASSGSTGSSSAGRAATPPATSSTPRSRCSSARTRGSRTASRARAIVLKEIAKDPGARADRDRPAPHRDRASWPTSTCRCARAPTPCASRALLAVLVAGGPASTTTSSPSTPSSDEALLARAARRPRRRLLRARAASTRSSCAPPRGASPRPASVSIFEDLGIQQAPHTTLNSYLEKLLFLLTGNFGQAGRHEHPHPHRQPRRRRPQATGRTPVSGAPHHHRPDPVQRRSPTRSSPTTPTASGR